MTAMSDHRAQYAVRATEANVAGTSNVFEVWTGADPETGEPLFEDTRTVASGRRVLVLEYADGMITGRIARVNNDSPMGFLPSQPVLGEIIRLTASPFDLLNQAGLAMVVGEDGSYSALNVGLILTQWLLPLQAEVGELRQRIENLENP